MAKYAFLIRLKRFAHNHSTHNSKTMQRIKKPMRSIAPILSARLVDPTLLTSVSSFGKHYDSCSSVICSSSFSFRPKAFLKKSKNCFVGRNSSKARLLSSCKTIWVTYGNVIFHICIKMRNWSKLIKFHRYFRPIERKIYRTRIPIEMVIIVVLRVPHN